MKKFWQWFVTALLVAVFLSLANWQWNRAVELANPPKLDPTIFPLDSIITPTQSLKTDQVGKKVSVVGKYVSNWISPNQASGKTWDVGFLQTKDNAMILVVRGFHIENQSKDLPTDTEVSVVGHLVPQQSGDRATNVENQISRVDSALFVTRTQLPLYAPFIQATSEEPSVGYQPVPFSMTGKVPGYYWQHISYVIIWFLFALTVLYLKFYQRRIDKSPELDKVRP